MIPLLSEMSAGFICGLVASGAFLLWGMGLGVWKFAHMRRPPGYAAPVYVDIAHRAALMYAFACLVLAALAQFSAWSEVVNVAAVVGNLLFFVSAVVSYIIHGLRGRERTQFSERNIVTTWGMWGLVVGELGGTLVLLTGVVAAIG